LSRWLGRVIIYGLVESKAGKLFLLNREKLEKAEAYFIKNGRSSTLVGRLIPGIRHLISIPAGLAKMNLGKFILYTAIGSAVWHTILAALSWYLYAKQELLKEYMHELSYILLGIGALFFVYLIIKNRRKKSRQDNPKS
jgi:membrane protein DedA with SNARE-associated domain